jgi:hypothetical protein
MVGNDDTSPRYVTYDVEFNNYEQQYYFENVFNILSGRIDVIFNIHKMTLFKCIYHYNRLHQKAFDFWCQNENEREELKSAYDYVFKYKNAENNTDLFNWWVADLSKRSPRRNLILLSTSKSLLQTMKPTLNGFSFVVNM